MSSSIRFSFLVVLVVLTIASAAFMPAAGNRAAAKGVWGASSSTAMGAATVIERDTVIRSTGPSILERPFEVTERPSRTTKEPTRDRKQQGDEAWEVRIYNDGLNTREHVARSLVQVTGMSELIAYQTMMHAHHNGIAVVGRWVFEVAEMYHEELKRNGIVSDIVPVDEQR